MTSCAQRSQVTALRLCQPGRFWGNNELFVMIPQRWGEEQYWLFVVQNQGFTNIYSDNVVSCPLLCLELILNTWEILETSSIFITLNIFMFKVNTYSFPCLSRSLSIYIQWAATDKRIGVHSSSWRRHFLCICSFMWKMSRQAYIS